LVELKAAYAPFFNSGLRVVPFAVKPQDTLRQVVSPNLAAMMAGMMGSVVSRGSGKATAIPGRWVAGKTGTRSDYRDA
jgi:penicillin-binding protein 1A